jgi:hypothetical protein
MSNLSCFAASFHYACVLLRSQDCFKSNWDAHKPIHKGAKAMMKLSTEMSFGAGFAFTGTHRPYHKVGQDIVLTSTATCATVSRSFLLQPNKCFMPRP